MILCFGKISESAAGKVKAVDFETEIETAWMPIIYPFTGSDSAIWALSVGQKIAWLEDDQGRGVVMGQIYDAETAAPAGSGVRLSIGGLSVVIDSGIFTVGTGLFLVRSDKAETKIGSLLDLLIAHTHTSAAPGSPTSPPVNVADFTTLKGEITAGALRTEKTKGE